MQGRGHILSKRGKENRSSTQQRTHICLKEGDIAETMFGWTVFGWWTKHIF